MVIFLNTLSGHDTYALQWYMNTHSVVVMDNCSVHHVVRVVEMINSVGALIRFQS